VICASCQSPNEDAATACAGCGEPLRSLAIGSVLGGRYEILQLLGKGGMGVVYKVHDKELDETVALKVLRPESTGSGTAEKRFRSEIKLARKVRHRNVCGIHEYGRDGPFQYIAMEYVPGVDLHRVLKERGSLPPAEAFDVSIQVAKGLQAIHAEGIVHRDLKTSNLMRDAQGAIRLMDFGIAKRFEGDVTHATAQGFAVGTPEYMSPEQVRGEPVDARSDIYALGIVVFELFTGHVPFDGDTPVATIFKQLQEPPPLDGPLAARLPPAILPVLERALAKDREDRFPSAAEVVQALRAARAETFPGAVPETHPLPVEADLDADSAVVPPPRTPTAASRAGTLVLEQTPEAVAAGRAGTLVLPETSPAAVRRPATKPRAPVRRPAPRPARGPWLPVLLGAGILGAGIGVAAYVLRSPAPAQRGADASPPAPASSVAPTVVPPPRAATAAPSTTRPPQAGGPGLGQQIAALDVLAQTDPVEALRRAERLAASTPGTEAQQAVARYRVAAATAHLAAGNKALRHADVSGSRQSYEDALRAFTAVLALDPSNAEALSGRDVATLALRPAAPTPAPAAASTASALSAGVGFSLGPTAFVASSGPPAGFRSVPEGVEVHRAENPTPRAQLVLEALPVRVEMGEEFTVRYSIHNTTNEPLMIRSVAIRNFLGAAGGLTGGPVDPLTRIAPPMVRTLLLEARGKWVYDPSTPWETTLTVVVDDGGSYRASLRARP
jgi:predicted Ser/Thr protein kinase